MIDRLTKRVEQLEEDNKRLKETVRGTTDYKWTLGDSEADTISASELATELANWANGDE